MVSTSTWPGRAVLAAAALLAGACGNLAQPSASLGNPPAGPQVPGNPANPASAQAVAAIDAAAQAYAQENLQPLQAMLPARFIGRAVLLDAAARAVGEQKKIELRLSDVRVQPSAAPDGPVAVTARWEKRFLKLPALTPATETGMLAAVLVRADGRWVFDSLNSDNPFAR
ncbi:MAG: hypothetical protein EOO28_13990 [Comamonadaceae bacterium]|nr:MAG: hypothetical protein EOO28_13990 [Comamonadaceae bacterium]